jgi:hypothetical protein
VNAGLVETAPGDEPSAEDSSKKYDQAFFLALAPLIRLTGIHDSMGNCNAKRRLCATLKSECPIKGTAAYC